jgi:hypothetical protein
VSISTESCYGVERCVVYEAVDVQYDVVLFIDIIKGDGLRLLLNASLRYFYKYIVVLTCGFRRWLMVTCSGMFVDFLYILLCFGHV